MDILWSIAFKAGAHVLGTVVDAGFNAAQQEQQRRKSELIRMLLSVIGLFGLIVLTYFWQGYTDGFYGPYVAATFSTLALVGTSALWFTTLTSLLTAVRPILVIYGFIRVVSQTTLPLLHLLGIISHRTSWADRPFLHLLVVHLMEVILLMGSPAVHALFQRGFGERTLLVKSSLSLALRLAVFVIVAWHSCGHDSFASFGLCLVTPGSARRILEWLLDLVIAYQMMDKQNLLFNLLSSVIISDNVSWAEILRDLAASKWLKHVTQQLVGQKLSSLPGKRFTVLLVATRFLSYALACIAFLYHFHFALAFAAVALAAADLAWLALGLGKSPADLLNYGNIRLYLVTGQQAFLNPRVMQVFEAYNRTKTAADHVQTRLRSAVDLMSSGRQTLSRAAEAWEQQNLTDGIALAQEVLQKGREYVPAAGAALSSSVALSAGTVDAATSAFKAEQYESQLRARGEQGEDHQGNNTGTANILNPFRLEQTLDREDQVVVLIGRVSVGKSSLVKKILSMDRSDKSVLVGVEGGTTNCVKSFPLVYPNDNSGRKKWILDVPGYGPQEGAGRVLELLNETLRRMDLCVLVVDRPCSDAEAGLLQQMKQNQFLRANPSRLIVVVNKAGSLVKEELRRVIDTYKGHVAASQIYPTSARSMYMGVLEQQELSLCLSEDEKFPMAPLLSAIASALNEPSGARPVQPFRPAPAVALGSWAAQSLDFGASLAERGLAALESYRRVRAFEPLLVQQELDAALPLLRLLMSDDVWTATERERLASDVAFLERLHSQLGPGASVSEELRLEHYERRQAVDMLLATKQKFLETYGESLTEMIQEKLGRLRQHYNGLPVPESTTKLVASTQEWLGQAAALLTARAPAKQLFPLLALLHRQSRALLDCLAEAGASAAPAEKRPNYPKNWNRRINSEVDDERSALCHVTSVLLPLLQAEEEAARPWPDFPDYSRHLHILQAAQLELDSDGTWQVGQESLSEFRTSSEAFAAVLARHPSWLASVQARLVTNVRYHAHLAAPFYASSPAFASAAWDSLSLLAGLITSPPPPSQHLLVVGGLARLDSSLSQSLAQAMRTGEGQWESALLALFYQPSTQQLQDYAGLVTEVLPANLPGQIRPLADQHRNTCTAVVALLDSAAAVPAPLLTALLTEQRRLLLAAEGRPAWLAEETARRQQLLAPQLARLTPPPWLPSARVTPSSICFWCLLRSSLTPRLCVEDRATWPRLLELCGCLATLEVGPGRCQQFVDLWLRDSIRLPAPAAPASWHPRLSRLGQAPAESPVNQATVLAFLRAHETELNSLAAGARATALVRQLESGGGSLERVKALAEAHADVFRAHLRRLGGDPKRLPPTAVLLAAAQLHSTAETKHVQQI